MPKIAQPNARPLKEPLIDDVLDLLPLSGECQRVAVVQRDEFSNDYAEVRMSNGRTLVIKRGRFPWSRERFEASRVASRAIRGATDLRVPAPLALSGTPGEPVEAYWRIELPTLRELWPWLGAADRRSVLRDLGALVGRLHSIETEGFGPLGGEGAAARAIGEHLTGELAGRLYPAVVAHWPAAIRAIETLAEAVGGVAARVGRRSRLLHGDLHAGNVLCERRAEGVRCVGLIDLETAQAGPPEADLAVMEVHHGPLFDHPLPNYWTSAVAEGYPHPADEWLVRFYRAYHLLNMGFYSALIGHDWHAARVAEAIEAEVDGLLGSAQAPPRHRPRGAGAVS